MDRTKERTRRLVYQYAPMPLAALPAPAYAGAGPGVRVYSRPLPTSPTVGRNVLTQAAIWANYSLSPPNLPLLGLCITHNWCQPRVYQWV